jgi:phosphate uptake regulator
MKRSIIQLGGKTYVVSLPISWIKKLELKKKDELDVIERGDELIISSQKYKFRKKIKVKINKKNKKLIRNLFLILGSLGYDEVIVNFDDSSLIPFIHEIAHEYSGFALIEQTKDKCFFRIVSKEIKEDFNYILDKCFKVTISLAKSFSDLVKEKKFKELSNLISLEKTNNQLTTLCQRILIKTGYKDQDKTCFVYVLLWNLEIIADFYRRGCLFLSNLPKNKANLKKETIKLIEMSTLLLEELYCLSKKTTINQFIDIFDKKEKIGENTDFVFEKGNFEDIVISHYIMDIVTFIQDCAVAYLGIFSGKENVEGE